MKTKLIVVAFAAMLTAAGATFSSSPAKAEPQTQTQTSARADCTLYILQRSEFGVSDSTRFAEGGLVGGALTQLYRRENPEATSRFAMGVLRPGIVQQKFALGFRPERFGFTGWKVEFVEFSGNLQEHYSKRKSSPRVIADSRPCYAELVFAPSYIRTSLYRKTAFLYVLREFGAQARPTRVIAKAPWLDAKAFPPRSDSPADTDAASVELLANFEASLVEFEAYVEKQQPGRRR